MATREIWHEILIDASSAEVYEAITDAQKLAHWWTTGARGESRIGSSLEFWFGEYCGSVVEVCALVKDEFVQWRVTGGGAQEWLDTELTFRIFHDQEQAILHFRHSNWRENASSFPHCSLGWAVFLLSLKEFVETGKGRPYPYDMPVNMWRPPSQ